MMSLNKALPRLLAFLILSTCIAVAQDKEGSIDPAPPKGITVDQAVQKFAEKEKVFKRERENYVYTVRSKSKISKAAKAALCIAGDAVCLMGAPKTPTIDVEPSICMKSEARPVVVNAPHCIRWQL